MKTRLKPPSAAIIKHIQNVMNQCGIDRKAIPDSKVVKKQTIINIYEDHGNHHAQQFALELAYRFCCDLIGLEHALEYTADLRGGTYKRCGSAYARSSRALFRDAARKKIEVVCIDQPDLADEEFENDLSVEQYCSDLMELSDNEDFVDDSLRNEFMAHSLYNFTKARKIVTVNGKLHFFDLSESLIAMDPEVSLFPIFLNVDEGYSSPRIKIHDYQVAGVSLKAVKIYMPDKNCFVSHPEFIEKVMTTIGKLMYPLSVASEQKATVTALARLFSKTSLQEWPKIHMPDDKAVPNDQSRKNKIQSLSGSS